MNHLLNILINLWIKVNILLFHYNPIGQNVSIRLCTEQCWLTLPYLAKSIIFSMAHLSSLTPYFIYFSDFSLTQLIKWIDCCWKNYFSLDISHTYHLYYNLHFVITERLPKTYSQPTTSLYHLCFTEPWVTYTLCDLIWNPREKCNWGGLLSS